MIRGIKANFTLLALAVILLCGCGQQVRPLQVSPDRKPEIVIYHHIRFRTAPVVYVIVLKDGVAEKWGKLGRDNGKITLMARDDFQVFLGHPVQEKISINRGQKLSVSGTIELGHDNVLVNLEIIPSSSATKHPIDGEYQLTDKEELKVIW